MRFLELTNLKYHFSFCIKILENSTGNFILAVKVLIKKLMILLKKSEKLDK